MSARTRGDGCARAQRFGQAHRIDAVDERECACRSLGLVGLQMADQMPSNFGQVRQLRALRNRLLDVVLAEVARAGPRRGANRLGWLRLAREHEPNRGGIAAGAAGSRGDPRSHDLQPPFNFIAHRHSRYPGQARFTPHRASAATTRSVGRPITLSRDPSTWEINPPPMP